MQSPITYKGTNTQNELSGTIWGNCPFEALSNKRVAGGVMMYDDFSSFNKTPATTEGNWGARMSYAQFSSTGGFITAPTISVATKAGVGSTGIVIGSDDINEGVGIRTLSTPFTLNRASGAFWFEAMISKTSIANTILDFFIGLMQDTALTAAVPIASASTLADKSLVGHFLTSGAGATGNTAYKTSGVAAVTVGSAESKFVAATNTKLGIKYVPYGDKDGNYIVSFYQDGVRLPTTKQLPDTSGLDFPTNVAMGLVLASQNAAGSSPGSVTVTWWAAAQVPLLNGF